jgi:hypothetical protein
MLQNMLIVPGNAKRERTWHGRAVPLPWKRDKFWNEENIQFRFFSFAVSFFCTAVRENNIIFAKRECLALNRIDISLKPYNSLSKNSLKSLKPHKFINS